MRQNWIKLIAVLAVFAMLQCHTFMSWAFGEAWLPEDTGGPETVAAEETDAPDSSAASEQEAMTPEATDGSIRQSSYVFQPKVCSVYMEEVFGKEMCETWFHLVDAVMAGEDTFACPDQHTYDWVMGQFPIRCFPVLTELIDFAYDRENLEEIPDGFRMIIEYKKSPIGYAQAYQLSGELFDEYDYPDDGHIVFAMDQFIGEPKYWSKGIGSSFLKMMASHLKDNMAAERVLLDPHQDNKRAIRAYEKAGFKIIKSLPEHEMFEGEKVDCWLMELAL